MSEPSWQNGISIAVLSSVAGAAIGIGIWVGTAGGTISEQGRRLESHHNRIERLESAIPAIREDLREIKVRLDLLVTRGAP
jgi:hypothetical protein